VCCVGAHCNHPSGRQSSRLIVSRTTPGETIRCRGMLAECLPQGQIHFVWFPSSDLIVHC
jgi:hypothetical protein